MRMFLALLSAVTVFAATPASAQVVVHGETTGERGRSTAFLQDPSAVPTGTHGTYRVTYRVATTGGADGDLRSFRRLVAATLTDDRGWSSRGTVAFEEVRADADLTIWLASPEAIVATGVGCSASYSCRVGPDVYINSTRWRDGADSYADRSLADYRRHVVNHEVGHWLGLGHRRCPARGAVAPVLLQQSKGLDGCEPRPWPLPREQRRALDYLESLSSDR